MTGSDYFEEARILVTVDLSKPGWDNLEPVELISSVDVVLLGLYQITDQVTPEQARDEFGEEALANLEELTERFRDAGVLVEKKLLFSVDFPEAIDRIAEEEDCNAILTWNEKTLFTNIGVFLRGEEQSSHLMDSLASIMADQDQSITLINFIDTDTDDIDEIKRDHQTTLETERDYLVERGLNEDQINISVEVVDNIDDAMIDSVENFDAIVMGETEPTVASHIFGTRHELVQEHHDGPVLIVRREHND